MYRLLSPSDKDKSRFTNDKKVCIYNGQTITHAHTQITSDDFQIEKHIVIHTNLQMDECSSVLTLASNNLFKPDLRTQTLHTTTMAVNI